MKVRFQQLCILTLLSFMLALTQTNAEAGMPKEYRHFQGRYHGTFNGYLTNSYGRKVYTSFPSGTTVDSRNSRRFDFESADGQRKYRTGRPIIHYRKGRIYGKCPVRSVIVNPRTGVQEPVYGFMSYTLKTLKSGEDVCRMRFYLKEGTYSEYDFSGLLYKKQ